MAYSLTKENLYYLDFENCPNLPEGVANVAAWNKIVHSEEYWFPLIDYHYHEIFLQEYFKEKPLEIREKFFKFAVSCLLLFVQENFTGPHLSDDIKAFMETEMFMKDFSYKLKNKEKLNANTMYPQLLLAAKAIFNSCIVDDLLNKLWVWRQLMIHQQVLEDLTTGLLIIAERTEKEIVELLPKSGLDVHTKVNIEIEMAQMYLMYRNIPKASLYISNSIENLGFKYEFEGKLGKRTKFQENIAQLALKITALKDDASKRNVNTIEVPQNIKMRDDVRLEDVEYVDDSGEPSEIPNSEQKIIFLKIQEKIISRPLEEILFEKIDRYINILLKQKNTWCVRVATLLMRCKLEAKHKRTVERSLQQCEEVLDSFWAKEPHFLNRVTGVCSVGLQPIWKTKAQLAELLISLGLVKKSLQIYEELQMWEEMISCYALLKMKQKAAKIIRAQLEKEPSEILWLLLGDVTDDMNCYDKAWDLSNKCCHQAKLRMAMYHYNRKQYDEALPHFDRCLSIHPLQPDVWRYYGYAALKVEKWQTAAVAYRKYTSLEPDSYDGWNNLGMAYSKMGNKLQAHKTYWEAAKCNFENWKVWENLLYASIDVSHYSDTINAYHRIVDINKQYLNCEVLSSLAYIAHDVKDEDKQPSEQLLAKFRELLARVSSTHQNEPRVWVLYASVTPVIHLRGQRLQRAYRGYTQRGWDQDPVKMEEMMHLCLKLGEVALHDDIGTNNVLLPSIKMNINSALEIAKKKNLVELKGLITDVTRVLENITKKIETGVKCEDVAEIVS